MDFLLIIVILLILSYILPRLQFNTKSYEPPTVPNYLPLIGHTWHLRFRAKEFLKYCRETYGEVFKVSYLSYDMYILSGEEGSRVLKADDSGMFEARNEIYFLVDALGEWKSAPGKPKHAISGSRLVKDYFNPLVKRNLGKILMGIQTKVQNKIGEQLHTKLRPLCSEIITSTITNIMVCKELANDEEFIKLIGGFYTDVEMMMKFGLMWLFIPYFGSSIAHFVIQTFTPSLKMRQAILEKITPILDKRTHNPQPDNIAEMMANDGHDYDAIADGLMLLAFLTLLTTSGACQRTISDLLGHPTFFNKLRQEQNQFDPILTPEQLTKMKYLDSTLRETMRHRGERPEHFRKAGKDLITNSGKIIPKHSLLAIDMASIHFKSKDSHCYQPFRFVPTQTTSHKLTADFLLFGTGRHACPGRVFATQLVVAIMASLIRSYYIVTKDQSLPPFITHEDYFPNHDIILIKLH